MKIRTVMRWLLVLGIAAGVLIGPAAPSMGAMRSAPTTAMTAPGTDENAMQMADGMPCCPKQQVPSRFDCDKCAFASCMIKLSGPGQVSANVEVPVYDCQDCSGQRVRTGRSRQTAARTSPSKQRLTGARAPDC
jgi:hypothetical protein